MALWYMKHGAWASAKDDVKDSEAKVAHSCLKKAAGLFEFIREKTGLPIFIIFRLITEMLLQICFVALMIFPEMISI